MNKIKKNNKRDLILGTIEDLISDFLYYDRKEDEELLRGDIEEAIKSGEITVEEMVEKFSNDLKKYLKYLK